MSRQRILFVVICVLLWPVATLVENRLVGLISPILWWLATQSGATQSSRAVFDTNHYLLVAPATGAILGLVPIRRLYEIAASSFAVFSRKNPEAETLELDWSRPVLWAWVLPTLAFLLRFIFWTTNRDHSVLGPIQHTGASAFVHFFGTSSFAMGANPLIWFYDRLMLTGPMLFLLAYTAAVWLRHHLPQHATPPELSDPVPTDTLGS